MLFWTLPNQIRQVFFGEKNLRSLLLEMMVYFLSCQISLKLEVTNVVDARITMSVLWVGAGCALS